VILVLLVLIGGTVFYYIKFVGPYEDTDDAFIEGYVTYVSPRVPGPVVKLLVVDNQRVKAGDVLVEIDPRDYQTIVDQATADLATANSRFTKPRRKSSLIKQRPSSRSQRLSPPRLWLARPSPTRALRSSARVMRYRPPSLICPKRRQVPRAPMWKVARNQAKAALAQVDFDRADVEQLARRSSRRRRVWSRRN